jgi:cellulose synthase (UDP-forming)
MIELGAFSPVALSVGAMLLIYFALGHASKFGRAVISILCVALTLRYIVWHGTIGMPIGQTPLQQAWAWFFFAIETMALMSAISVYIFMSRTRDRSPDADRAQLSPLLDAPVDVFIATYNEQRAIVERTIVGAMAIEHPDLRVWVLDDGARDWLRDLAAELGVEYVRRVNGKRAKAGNVNNGLRHALATGRKPEFVLLLDADFVPKRKILKRTLGLFEEPDVGIVQTPQHFFNPDPIQSNLLCSSVWPDEQRFFFEVLMPAKDAWGAAFCCGTSAVFRVAALEATDGLAVETVTEDMLTTFKMEENGFRTIFLNEHLSMGLAPEGLQDYISQRGRWCLGAIQQVYTRWSFAGPAPLRFISRLSSLDGVLYWAFTAAFKILMITSPMVYWWTGTAVIASDVSDLIYWLGPSAIGGIVYMTLYSRNRVMPIMTDVTQLLSSWIVVRTVATGLVKPFGRPFKVTAKGISIEKVTVQWPYLLPFSFAALGTFLGMLINTSSFSELNGTPGYAVNIFWSIYNIILLVIAVAICVEPPRRRQHERFAINERAIIRRTGHSDTFCLLDDLSIGGAKLRGVPPNWGRDENESLLLLDGGALPVPCRPVRALWDGSFAVEFEAETDTRRALITKLFTGEYRNSVERIDVPRVLLRVAKKLLT